MEKLWLAVLAAGIVWMLSSCNKDNDEIPRSQMLIGSWKTIRAADDVNGNGTWDASEDVDLSDDTLRLLFHGDGNGLISGEVVVPISYRWNLQNANTELRIIIPSLADTSISHIISLTSTELVTKNDTSKTRAFIAFRKQ